MSTLRVIHPHYVCQLWPDVRDMLGSALADATGLYSLDQLQLMLVRGEHVLLVAEEGGRIVGAATVVFENFPNARLAFVSAIAGRLVGSRDLFRQFVAWLLEQGVTRIGGQGPETIARLWRQKFGFRTRFYFERDISHDDLH